MKCMCGYDDKGENKFLYAGDTKAQYCFTPDIDWVGLRQYVCPECRTIRVREEDLQALKKQDSLGIGYIT